MNSTTNQRNLLELAKQGNAQAIAALMNRQLQPKGITAKAALKNGCLQVMLESVQVPNQQALVEFIRKGVTALEVTSIQKVKVYGRQTGEEFPAWSQELELEMQSNPFSDFLTFPSQESQPTSLYAANNTPHQTSTSTNRNLFYDVEGVNGQIRLTHNRLIISRKGANAFFSQGLKGDKEIPINRITAVEFKPADSFTNGYLQLSIQGSLESKGDIFAATQDENTVMFSALQQPEFVEVKKYIDSVIDGEPINFSRLRFPELKAQKVKAEGQIEAQSREAKAQAIEADQIFAKKAIPVLGIVVIASLVGTLIASEGSALKVLSGFSLITSAVCLIWAWLKSAGKAPSLATNSGNNQQTLWYEKNSVIILLLLFFCPVGLYLMWRYSQWSTPAKWLITAICSFWFFVAIS